MVFSFLTVSKKIVLLAAHSRSDLSILLSSLLSIENLGGKLCSGIPRPHLYRSLTMIPRHSPNLSSYRIHHALKAQICYSTERFVTIGTTLKRLFCCSSAVAVRDAIDIDICCVWGALARLQQYKLRLTNCESAAGVCVLLTELLFT